MLRVFGFILVDVSWNWLKSVVLVFFWWLHFYCTFELTSQHTHHWQSKWKWSWWGCITLESTQRTHIEHSIMARSTKCVRNAIQNSVVNVHLLKRWNEDIQWIQSNRLAGEKDPFECEHREFISLVNIKRQLHLE